MNSQQIATSTNGTIGKGFKFAAATAAVVIMTVFAAGSAVAATPSNTPQNVNVVNTPAVKATITAPGPLTNVGRLASQHVTLNVVNGGICSTHVQQILGDGNATCFDLSNDPAQALVITDTSFFGQTTPGNTCGMFLFSPNGAGYVLLPSIAPAAADGTASKSEHLTTGVVLTGNPLVLTTCTGESVLLQGYLVPNQ
jgi:hypothetical protein